ncbi:MAG: CopG family ribbon-helix-helix protein [Thaumarchaeota archaeon]|nr:CopG family ribbon-helix-helix protein [Nitrososphaerota archaeon]
MPIVSLSFPETMLKEMDAMQGSRGFTGRSELVRAGIRLLIQDVKEKDTLSGKVSAVVVVTHTEENEEKVTQIKHRFDDIVRTHIHNKITRSNCVELFLLEGDAKEVAKMTGELQREDKIKSVKLVMI